jgi:hypothetical protein
VAVVRRPAVAPPVGRETRVPPREHCRHYE